MKITNLFLTIIFISQSVYAQDSNLCKVNTTQPKQRVKLPTAPNFFISADPTGKYTGVIDGADSNVLVNMENGTQQTVPGDYDPVFTPDGKFLTLPDGQFYELSKISARVDSGQSARGMRPDFDADDSGVYQSVGILPGQTEKKKTYRYMHDGAGASFFDVEVEFDSAGNMKNSKRLTRTKRMCEEASNRDTPMLSKDGKYLSILNFETYTTQIWKINDDGSCDMMVDIGVPTGKVDFGFDEDNPQITFHVDESSNNWHYFSGVSESQRKSVYVMNLDKNGTGDDERWAVRDMAKITAPNTGDQGSGSYYPRFRKDGSLVAVTQDGQNEDYYLDVYQTQDLDYVPFYPEVNSGRILSGTTCSTDQETQYQSLVALGWLWAQTCSDFESELRNADLTLIPMGLDRKACLELVSKKWEQEKSKYRSGHRRLHLNSEGYDTEKTYVDPRQAAEADLMSLSIADLQAVCPDAESREIQDIEVIGHTGENIQLTEERLIAKKCSGCHESSNVTATENGYEISDTNAPFVDFKNINSAEDAMVWRTRIFNPRPRSSAMPPPEDLDGDGEISEPEFQRSLNENFTQEEQQRIKERLRQIESGESTWQYE